MEAHADERDTMIAITDDYGAMDLINIKNKDMKKPYLCTDTCFFFFAYFRKK